MCCHCFKGLSELICKVTYRASVTSTSDNILIIIIIIIIITIIIILLLRETKTTFYVIPQPT